MLKIKDNVDLKELERYGFKAIGTDANRCSGGLYFLYMYK